MILAGGSARRMGGVNKGLKKFQDSTLIAKVIKRVKDQVNHLAINANRDLDIFQQMGWEVWSDSPTPFDPTPFDPTTGLGPLSGFLTGLKNCPTPYLMIVPCDTPLLPLNLVALLSNQMSLTQADICMAVSSTDKSLRASSTKNDRHPDRYEPQVQPTCCLLKISLKDSLEQFLESGGRKVLTWTQNHSCEYVHFRDTLLNPKRQVDSDTAIQSFVNVNTEQELFELEAVLKTNQDS
jgi:molybdopterin-guanine dinucleotide biosynthesis protein A